MNGSDVALLVFLHVWLFAWIAAAIGIFRGQISRRNYESWGRRWWPGKEESYVVFERFFIGVTLPIVAVIYAAFIVSLLGQLHP